MIAPSADGAAVVPLGPLGRGHRTVRARARRGPFGGAWAESDLYLPEWVLPDATAGDDFARWLSYREPAGAGQGGEISTPDVKLAHPRAGTRGRRDAAGKYQTLMADVIATDHDDAGVALGLQIERLVTYQGVNSLMTGLVTGSPGTPPTGWGIPAPAGLTRTLSLDTSSGRPRLRIHYVGAPTSNFQFIGFFHPSLTVAAAPGQIWTHAARFGGQGTGLDAGSLSIAVWETDAANTLLRSSNLGGVAPLAHLRRSKSLTVGAGTAFLRFLFATGIIAAATPCDFWIDIECPTLTQTSYLPSEYLVGTSALTRAPDTASAALGDWFGAAGTLLSEYLLPAAVPSALGNAFIASLSDGTIDNEVALFASYAGNPAAGIVMSEGALEANIYLAGAVTAGQIVRQSMAWQAGDARLVAGAVAGVPDTTVVAPDGLTTLQLGRRADGTFAMEGWLRRWFYVPRAMTTPEIQAAHSWLEANP